jgi:hypothetical protein
MTRKHKNKTDIEQKAPESPTIEELHPHKCDSCGKLYNARNSLWYHSRKCTKQNQHEKDNIIIKTLIEKLSESVWFW